MACYVFLKVLATVCYVYFYEDDLGESQRACVLRRIGCFHSTVSLTFDRKGRSLPDGSLWLAHLVEVSGTQIMCVCIGMFLRAKKSLVWA